MGDKIRHKHRGRHFSQIANYSLVAGLFGGVTTFFIFYGRPDDDITPYKWLFVAGGIIGISSLIFILPIKDKPQNGHCVKIVKPSELSGDFRYFLYARGAYNFFMSIGWPLFIMTQAGVLGASNIEIALMAFIGIGATIAFQPLVGRMNDRVGPVWLITTSMFLFIAVPVTYMFATSMFELYLLSFVIGFSSASSNVAFSTYILDVSPPEAKAEYFAYHGLVCGVTGFCGSLLAGMVANYLHVQLLWSLAAALMPLYIVCAVGRSFSAFMFLKVKDPKKYPSTARQFGAAYYERIRSIWRRP
jgi:MFS family permease